MLRALAFSLLGLALLAGPATAQTTPTRKPAAKAAPRPMARRTARRPPGPQQGHGDSKGLNTYAAPGQPVNPTTDDGKHLPPYDGPAARPAAGKGTTLPAPK